MSDNLCIYHSHCLDGFTSAVIVRNWAKENNIEMEFFAAGYDYAPPDVTGKTVYIVDFSYKREVLAEMAKIAKKIIIIDHHKTAEENLKDIDLEFDNIEVNFDMTRSGAMLTWHYFNSTTVSPGLVLYVQDHDLWQYKLKNTKEIILALYSYEMDFDVWEKIFRQDHIAKLISEGEVLSRQHFKNCHSTIKSAKYYIVIKDNIKIPVLNCSPIYSSDIGNIMALDAPYSATYSIDKNQKVRFSLRSNKDNPEFMDVSIIASSFGGGGHLNSSGFYCSLEDFIKFEVIKEE